MDWRDDFSADRTSAGKKLKQGDIDEYQSIIELYCALSRTFKWTPLQIDEQEIEMKFGYIAALSDEKESGQYIDEIGM